MTNWPWPMQGVQNWFEGLWDWISTAAINAVSVVDGWIWGAIDWLKARLDESFTAVTGLIGDTWDNISSALSEGWNTITEAVGAVVGDVVDGVKDLVAGIGEGLDAIVSSIGETVKSGLEGFGDALSNTAAWIGGELRDRIGDLKEDVTGFVTDAVQGGMDWVTRAIAGVSGALGDGFKALITWIMESLQDLARGISGALVGVRDAVEPILSGVAGGIMGALTSAIAPGTPEEEIDKSVKEFADAYMKRMLELSKFEEGSVPPLSALIPRAAGVVAANLGAAVAGQVVGSALDLAHPVKDIGFRMIAMDLVNSVQMPAMVGPLMMGPVWSGLIIPLRYRFNEMNPTAVPDPRWLPDLAARGTISEDDCRQALKFHALDNTWASAMIAAAYRAPVYSELQLMYWREALSEADVGEALQLQGIRTDYLPGYHALLERIPGPGDLIRMAVREAFTRPELDVEFPAEFAANMAKQGYAEIWAKYFWRAHWVLVPLGQLYTLYHRGLITRGDLEEQLRFHDYTPEWRGKLIALSWNMPGRIDARWMFRWGQITVDELRDLLIAQGLDPAWADRVALATAKNQWLTEINRLRDNAKRDYVRGYVTEDQLRANLEGLGYPPEWIVFHVRDAVEDGERELRDDVVNALGDGYMKDLVTEEDLELGLMTVIVRPRVVQMELERLYIRKYKRPKAPTAEKVPVLPTSTLRTAYREEIITESMIRDELAARGYLPEDIDLMIALEEERRPAV